MVRVDVQPAGLMGHHSAHDMVERFAFCRVCFQILEQVALGAFRVLEDAVVRVEWIGVIRLG